MAKRYDSHIFNGMQRDLSVSKHPANFLYDARNIRLTAREGSTLLSITNEKGTADTGVRIEGTYLGHTLLNQYLVVFHVSGNISYITRFDLSKAIPERQELFRGNLNFSEEYPIEAIASYESEMIQKVYWTDYHNQPRSINIIGNKTTVGGVTMEDFSHYKSSVSLDFVPDLQLNEDITVEKVLGASGMFAPGVIQYAFTYYAKYGHETNIFYTTPLLYISYRDRGASPEDKVENAFRINIRHIDSNFDYLRIYSIQRTSLNATPVVKRIQDIEITGDVKTSLEASFVDTGTVGDTIDPKELLYKGGEPIKAGTIEQKDNTLFLGNIILDRPNLGNLRTVIEAGIKNNVVETTRIFQPTEVSTGSYIYYNQLTSFAVENGTVTRKTVPCAGFKHGDCYRLGVQFQHVSGKWSDPIYVDDKTMGSYRFQENPVNHRITVPIFCGRVDSSLISKLIASSYRKVRAVVVYPGLQDRNIICQGVVNPTLYTYNHRNRYDSTDKTDTHTEAVGDLQAQSSWFFRPTFTGNQTGNNMSVSPSYTEGALPYTHKGIGDDIPKEGDVSFRPFWFIPGADDNYIDFIRNVEIQGDYDDDNKFCIRKDVVTMHSPDIEFDDSVSLANFAGSSCLQVGLAEFQKTFSDIDIQTESPTISNSGSGFVHRSFAESSTRGIVSGLFYDDYIVEDWQEKEGERNVITELMDENSTVKWMVYLWNKGGSLNNDINRPADKGTASSVLKKKVISNLRYATTDFTGNAGVTYMEDWSPELFSSDENTILKFGDNIYRGNVDTMLVPDNQDGMYFVSQYNPTADVYDNRTEFTSNSWWKTFSHAKDAQGLYKFNGSFWMRSTLEEEWRIGNQYKDLVLKKDAVRMKYKSTPHLVFGTKDIAWNDTNPSKSVLPIVEISQKSIVEGTRFGGKSTDAKMSNIWIPCGEPVSLYNLNGTQKTSVDFYWEWGDTYYQRYDCLKTYAYTREDINQVVEIGSFMLETHVNIDGRYDRNRGQINNLNMNPANFNLMNPVYNQLNNFFTYRMQNDAFYSNTEFPNQITWSKEKSSGADIDLWTNITLASVYDMDGSKGRVESLNTWKDQIYCFQSKGISNILFNSRVQIPTSDSVPIEIGNSYKVDGYRYISDGIGCSDKRLIKETPAGIYFVDSVGSHLFHIAEGLTDLSEQCNLTTWFKDNIGTVRKTVYDDINHDVYLVQDDKVLCFSEKLNQFTGFYDYGSIDLIETCNSRVFTMYSKGIWRMFEGGYNKLLGVNTPWWITFVSNGINEGLVNIDKTFTNLEFRAIVEDDGTSDTGEGRRWSTFDNTFDFTFFTTEGGSGKGFVPYLPVDYLETWDEYQHGMANLSYKNGHTSMQHHLSDASAHLDRKFRIWRCDIPRDNMAVDSSTEKPLGIFRKARHAVDRMRNPWLFIKLRKNEAAGSRVLPKTELHDLMVTYFG